MENKSQGDLQRAGTLSTKYVSHSGCITVLAEELNDLNQEEGIGRETNYSILCQYTLPSDGEDESVIIFGDEWASTNSEESDIMSTKD